MSQSEMIAAEAPARMSFRRAAAPRKLTKRQVEALLYDAVAEALGFGPAEAAPVKRPRRHVAARTRQLETA